MSSRSSCGDEEEVDIIPLGFLLKTKMPTTSVLLLVASGSKEQVVLHYLPGTSYVRSLFLRFKQNGGQSRAQREKHREDKHEHKPATQKCL